MTGEVLERIAQRYHDTKIRLEVPEWGSDDEPAVFYSRLFTVEDERAILRQSRDPDDPETIARLVFRKLEDEAGEKVFANGDFQRFKRTADSMVLKTIASRIMAGAVSIEDAEKN